MECPRCDAVLVTSYDEQICMSCVSSPGQGGQPTAEERSRPAREQPRRKYPRQYA